MNVLLSITMAMVGGLILSRIVKYLHLPNVTGYLIAGIVFGPYCLKLITLDSISELKAITTVALGFIAFSIGGEFKLSYLKQLGKSITVITFTQALSAVFFVMASLFIVRAIRPDLISVPAILLMSAIATATAPAATIMVVRQYKAKGPVTDALLPVVAFDDAIGLMVFAVCFAVAKMLATGEPATFMNLAVKPLLEIVFSLAVGGAIGGLLALCMKFFKSRANRLCLMITSVLACVGLSQLLELSSLLTCMALGAVFANARTDSGQIVEGSDRWTPPLFMLFFVLSGAELNIKIIPYVGLVGVVYILFRAAGKYMGAYFGSSVVKADKNIKKYLGVTLWPQAGVEIGMVQIIATEPVLAEYSPQITTAILAAIMVYSLLGPVFTKMALTKAGEIEKGSGNSIFAFLKKKKAAATGVVDLTVENTAQSSENVKEETKAEIKSEDNNGLNIDKK